MAVLAGIFAAAYFDVFKVTCAEVAYIIALLLAVEVIFFFLLKVNAPVAFVKYYGLLSMEACVMAMIANAYFGVYISYVLVPVISCLYFDKKLTLNITAICYAGMLIALWFRAPGAIMLAYPGYTQVSWFIGSDLATRLSMSLFLR